MTEDDLLVAFGVKIYTTINQYGHGIAVKGMLLTYGVAALDSGGYLVLT